MIKTIKKLSLMLLTVLILIHNIHNSKDTLVSANNCLINDVQLQQLLLKQMIQDQIIAPESDLSQPEQYLTSEYLDQITLLTIDQTVTKPKAIDELIHLPNLTTLTFENTLFKELYLNNEQLSENITSLIFKDNQELATINIESLPNLKTIELYNNQGLFNLIALQLPELSDLKIDASFNELGRLQLSNAPILAKKVSKGDYPLSQLTQLDLPNNNLTEIDLSYFPNLYHLDLNNNQLTDTSFDLSKTPSLVYLNLAQNNLKSINVQGLPNLFELYLHNNLSLTSADDYNIFQGDYGSFLNQKGNAQGNNRIESLDITGLKYLHTLNISGNQVLNTLIINDNPSLYYVRADMNALKQLSIGENVDSLYELYCSYNQLTTLDLSNIDLEELTTLYPNEFIKVDASFNALTIDGILLPANYNDYYTNNHAPFFKLVGNQIGFVLYPENNTLFKNNSLDDIVNSVYSKNYAYVHNLSTEAIQQLSNEEALDYQTTINSQIGMNELYQFRLNSDRISEDTLTIKEGETLIIPYNGSSYHNDVTGYPYAIITSSDTKILTAQNVINDQGIITEVELLGISTGEIEITIQLSNQTTGEFGSHTYKVNVVGKDQPIESKKESDGQQSIEPSPTATPFVTTRTPSPYTGDLSHEGPLLIMMFLAVATLGYLTYQKKKLL